jgi:hypothetical protein
VTGVRVTYVDAEPNGLAAMVGGLIEANLDRHPERRDLLRPAVVDLVAIDADVATSLRLDRSEVRVANGIANGRAHLRLTADSIALVELAATPLRLGFPDVLHREGRLVTRRVLARDIRIEGLVRHPLTMSRLSRLLSVV